MFDLQSKVETAIARRESLRAPQTNALRLIHGIADDLPGIYLDDFDGHWLLQTTDPPRKLLLDCFRPPRCLYWKKLETTARSNPTHVFGERIETAFPILENGLTFLIDFHTGYSQGLFLDQRDNRKRVRQLAHNRRILNTFSYTCAFGIAGVAGGGNSLDLDLSRTWLDWGQKNYDTNGFAPETHDAIFGDVFDWLARFARKGREFDLIILDPPSFSRNNKGGTFQIEKDYARLVGLAAGVLSKNGILLCCTNLHRLTTPKFHQLIREGLPQNSAWHLTSPSMPEDFGKSTTMKSVWVRRS